MGGNELFSVTASHGRERKIHKVKKTIPAFSLSLFASVNIPSFPFCTRV